MLGIYQVVVVLVLVFVMVLVCIHCLTSNKGVCYGGSVVYCNCGFSHGGGGGV